MREYTMMRWLFIFARMAMGGIFLLAGVPKMLNPHGFSEMVYNYLILPDPLVNIVALGLPALEVVCGVALVLGVFTRGASLIVAVLMVSFMVAIAYTRIIGLDIACGCFSVSPEDAAAGGSAWTLVRDATILLLSFVVLVGAFSKGQDPHKL